MNSVAVGIDIGTSYTKAVARVSDGQVVGVYRLPSPQTQPSRTDGPVDASLWWHRVREVLRGLLISNPQLRVVALCVSAIAPTLTLFDAERPDSAFAILYSSLTELPDDISLSQCDPRLAERRLTVLAKTAREKGMSAPRITDLVGYVNWRLTGELTMNTVSLAESGAQPGSKDCAMLAAGSEVTPRLVAPGQRIGETTLATAHELGISARVPVAGGCPDTMSSVVGAGLCQESETMLYLGTFGSLLRLGSDVESLLCSTATPDSPFQWMLSVPGLGPEVESLGREWYGSSPNALAMLDEAAEQAEVGAGGTIFMVPRWKNGMTAAGTYEFVANRGGDMGDVRRRARAVLEGVAYAALAVGAKPNDVLVASGGGARSRAWLDALSAVLNAEVRAREMSWEAVGAADIAARLVWNASVDRNWYSSTSHLCASRVVIEDNYYRVKERYRGSNWL